MSTYTVHPGDTVEFMPNTRPHAPDEIRRFLLERNWRDEGTMSMWHHSGKSRWSLSWEQAMACEFYEFVTLGGR